MTVEDREPYASFFALVRCMDAEVTRTEGWVEEWACDWSLDEAYKGERRLFPGPFTPWSLQVSIKLTSMPLGSSLSSWPHSARLRHFNFESS